MKFDFYHKNLDSYFAISDNIAEDQRLFKTTEGLNYIYWNRQSQPISLEVDGVVLSLKPNQIITTTLFHKVQFSPAEQQLTGLTFNREFYCLLDHDKEVGCNGILFFGSQEIPVISLTNDNLRKFELLWDVLVEEFKTSDTIQSDMLQMLLKRFIILSTRIAKEQLVVKELNHSQVETIRKFNLLVDINFRTMKQVKDYAALLHKAPKTLSNLFSLNNQKSPLQIIQDRVVLEAKRLLRFTDKQTQEIAYELGFDDPAHFSRYFKKVANISPSAFKASLKGQQTNR